MQDATRADAGLTTDQAAAYLGLAPATLADDRCTGRLRIPFTRIGRAIRYRLPDLEEYLDRCRVVPGGGVEGE